MTEPRDLIISLLEQAAAADQPRLEAKVRPRLDEREQRLLSWLLGRYRDATTRRWYDPCHILYSTNFALDLVAAEQLDRLIVSGIILHDVGYFAIPDKSWSSPHSRIAHMQEGTALAARVLYEHGFAANELETILGMIAVHDNPYIGIAIEGRDRLGLRDCDRVWVMHLLSFYKDVTSQPERYEQPQEYLHDRLIQFYGYTQPFGETWAASIDGIKKNAPRIEVPSYELTRQIVRRQFGQRIKELANDDLLRHPEQFRVYLAAQLDKE